MIKRLFGVVCLSLAAPVAFGAAAEPSVAPAAEAPQVSAVGTVAPDVILVTIRAQRVEHGRQVPYEPTPGDKVAAGIHRWVTRGGKMIGVLAGAEGKILFTTDELFGEPLDVQWAGRADSYRIVSPDDDRFAKGVAPKSVHRKSRPFDFCRTGSQHGAPQDHLLYLTLPAALENGKRYTVEFLNGKLAAASADFVYDPAALLSDAVHVSQVGFRPTDPAKVAFLSCWMGDGGGLSYPDGLAFSLIDAQSGKAVFEGKTRLTKRATEGESGGKENYELADVHELDFSRFATPGTYRVSVEGVGCSLPFPIADDVWTKAFSVSVRGLYHQRSGIELGPPHTDYRRPRAFHPDDGVKVYHTSYSSGEQDGAGGGFAAIVAGKTDEIVPNAWGGYMDAGDWDRRPVHIAVPRLLMDLYEMSPATFDKLNLNIPESDDDLPDLLNEALWVVDFHQRTQTPDGGIRPGIESSEHPRRGEASWQESLTVMAYAPGVNMSYNYAGVAAHAAFLLEKNSPQLAQGYRESALKAFQWADAHRKDKNAANKDAARALAAVEFFRLTGEAKWHEIFLAATRFRNGDAAYAGVNPGAGRSDPQDEAGWVYWRTDRPGVEAKVKENFKRALLANADARLGDIAGAAFRWVASKGKTIGYSTSVIPDVISLARAHSVTRDDKYLRGVVLACQIGVGANPLNLCYTTGVGLKTQQHMVHEDSYVSHQPLPPGLTVNGPYNPRGPVAARHEGMVRDYQRFVYPAAKTWPALESYWDVGVYSPMSEYTVHRNIAPNAYAWGYLAIARE